VTRAISPILAFLLAMVIVAISLLSAVPPASAANAARECGDAQSTSTIRTSVCVNGSENVRVRGYPSTIVRCLTAVNIKNHPAGEAVFPKSTCSTDGPNARVQGERIAQARFTQWLDAQNRRMFDPRSDDLEPGVINVHPGVQWEIRTGFGASLRADVLNYEPDYAGVGNPSRKLMSLWELKTSVDYDSYEQAASTTAFQARSYADVLKQERIPYSSDGSAVSLWDSMEAGPVEGYTDEFVVIKRSCEDRDERGRPWKSALEYTFVVRDGVGYEGAIIAERTVREYKCDDDGERENEVYKTENAYEANKFWRFGKPGKDLDIERDNLVPVPDSFCRPLMSACQPLQVPAPNPAPNPQPQPQPQRQESAVVRATFLRSDPASTLFWQEKNAPFCEAIAQVERKDGAAVSPLADKCSSSASLATVLGDVDSMSLLTSLDAATLRGVMENVWSWVTRDGVGNVSSPARVTGDPHLVTLDGLNYDMQSVGEFSLLDVPEREITIQARFAAAGTQSSVIALATEWGGTKVEVRADGTILANGESMTLAPGQGFSANEDEVGGYFYNDGGTFRLSWDSPTEGEAPVAMSWQPINAALGGFGVQVPPGLETDGLLGDNDGNPLDDLKTREGLPIDASDATAIHDAYADSWRIVDGVSLFTYGPGQTTQSFTDRSFPQELVTTGDFPAAEQVTAQQACEAAGITAGPAFRNCVLDVLVTRDADFATAFVGVQDAVRSADDKVMTGSEVRENFSAVATAPNFSPLRTTTEAGLSGVAGPFTGAEQYRFHVPSLPRHDQVTVAFDLIAIGQWDTADTVALRIDGRQPQSLDLGGAAIGALSSGEATRTKRVSVPVDHFSDLISVALAGSGLDSPQRFAIDNIEVGARVVAPDTFAPVLVPGTSVALRAPSLGAGSGVLERWGAQDAYSFSASHQDLLLDWQTRSETVKWSLENAAGKVIDGGLSSAGNARLRDLNGDLTLKVQAAGEVQPTTETYSLDLLLTPEAELFGFELPGPVRLPADLPSPAVANGAGSLETKLSADIYSFTVSGDDRAITVNPTACPYQGYRQRLNWTILDSSGVTAANGSCWTQTVSGLRAGEYRLRVEPEREATGQYAITVNQEGATTRFSTPPAAASNQRTQTLNFESAEAASFECALDAPSYTGPFTACTSPKSFRDLADGDHTVMIRAKDTSGNRGPAITHRVTIDTAVPDLRITRKPPVQSNINGPVLEYSAEKQGMTYQCSLVPVGTATKLSDCYGASVYRDLAHGTYRFTVTGTDWVGNQSTASYDFMVDLEPPVITLTPGTNLTSTSSPQFTFTANETATYECSLVPASQLDAFSPCTSPKQYSGLVDGTQYRFLVKATDVAGQWSARGVTWTPYATPPSVTISSKPAGTSTNSSPSFAFTSNMSSPIYECSLELASQASVFTACTSPKAYSGKAAGTYKFVVKATDPSGSWVSSSYQFAISAPSGDTQAPTVPGVPSAVIAPAGSTVGADTDSPASGIPVRVSWTASTDNVGVAGYQLSYSTNGGAYVTAGNTTGAAVTMTIPAGATTWRYQVRAFDAAGNLSASATAASVISVALDQETTTSRITYSGTWTNASSAANSGGATKYATATSASATYKPVSGTNQVAVVMSTGPSSGKASIAIDGGTAATVDLYSATAGTRSVVLSSATLSATTAHTIVVKPLGTKNTASSGTRIDLDGFVTRK
jgi:hypothetical protein